MSIKMDMRMAQPRLAPSSRVNCVVWVRKPGPMAETAIRKAAPVEILAGRGAVGIGGTVSLGCAELSIGSPVDV
jgi:hypothetical protein